MRARKERQNAGSVDDMPPGLGKVDRYRHGAIEVRWLPPAQRVGASAPHEPRLASHMV